MIGCPTCAGAAEPGWLCEDHPTLPWQHDDCGGAGIACVCNPTAAVRWRQVYRDADDAGDPAAAH